MFKEDEEDGVGELVIIFEGLVELYTVMDNGIDFQIEHLSKGTIFNPRSFLIGRKMDVSARFAQRTTYYTLTAEKFGDIASEYRSLHDAYNDVVSAALAAKERQTESLDYIPGRHPFDSGIADMLNEEEKDRCRATLLSLKNAVMYYIARNRKDRKVPKLKDVLE